MNRIKSRDLFFACLFIVVMEAAALALWQRLLHLGYDGHTAILGPLGIAGVGMMCFLLWPRKAGEVVLAAMLANLIGSLGFYLKSDYAENDTVFGFLFILMMLMVGFATVRYRQIERQEWFRRDSASLFFVFFFFSAGAFAVLLWPYGGAHWGGPALALQCLLFFPLHYTSMLMQPKYS